MGYVPMKCYHERAAEMGDAVPTIENIHQTLYDTVSKNRRFFDMTHWHGGRTRWDPEREAHCGTTHCRAGWVVHLAGKAGYELERMVNSTELAAGLIYAKSDPTMETLPSFYQGDYEALDSMEFAAQRERQQQAAKAAVETIEEKLPAQCPRRAKQEKGNGGKNYDR